LVFACISGIFSVMYGNVAGILPTAIYLLGVTFLATVARNMSPKQRLAIMIALPVMHFSWGIGFWRGYFIGAKGTLDKSRVTK
jgi:hypothetical protein